LVASKNSRRAAFSEGTPVSGRGQVDRREIERQAEQVVAQRAGHELVDLVADLAGHAADDRARSEFGVDGGPRAVGLELRAG
jgi:hypothetical protein